MSLPVCNATAGTYLRFLKSYRKRLQVVASRTEGVMPFVLKLTQWHSYEYFKDFRTVDSLRQAMQYAQLTQNLNINRPFLNS